MDLSNPIDAIIAKCINALEPPKIHMKPYEDIFNTLPDIADGPYTISPEEMAELKQGRPVPQPAYRRPWIEPLDPNIDPGKVEWNGQFHDIAYYLGDQWAEENIVSTLQYTSAINEIFDLVACYSALHNQPTVAIPKSFAVKPHSWQLSGAGQMDYLCRSMFKGGLCGDEMGLGKTLLAILAMEMPRKEKGCFSLVVCPASCRDQWKSEIMGAYLEGLAPKTIILDDAHTTPNELLDGRYEIVIVSYNFLSDRFREFQNFWKKWKLPIKRLVLDECQKIKRENGASFRAAKALYRRATILLSATLLDNVLHVVTNPLLLLRGHPLTTRDRFLSAFVEHSKRKGALKLTGPNIMRLQRFFMALMIARPATILELPGLEKQDAIFELNKDEVKEVSTCVTKYRNAQALRQKVLQKGLPEPENNPLGNAVNAQLWAAHRLLIANRPAIQRKPDESEEIENDMGGVVTRLVSINEEDDPVTRAKWLRYLEEIPIEELLDSCRLQALLKVWVDARKRSPKAKIVVFSSFLNFLDIVAAILRREYGVESLMFHGFLSSSDKVQVREIFSEESNQMPLLITSRVGSCGLNLQQGSIVIQSEIWWNANTEKQAYALCYRQGQQKDVRVIRLFSTNSDIDIEIKRVQEKKRTVNNEVMKLLLHADGAPLFIPDFWETKDADVMSIC